LLYYIDDTAPEMIEGDVIRIRQILINLLNNSVKFTEEGEVFITLTGRMINPEEYPDLYELHFSVRDTGIGIPKEHASRVFETFYRVSDGLVHSAKGSGLGLSIAKHIMDAHGGRIDLTSVPGKGSTFRLAFPMTDRR